jgi:hypothetical protein
VTIAGARRAARVEGKHLDRVLEPAALVVLLVVLPLESVLVIPTQLLIPPYIVVLPVLLIISLLAVRTVREFLPERNLTIALAVWIGANTLSLAGWLIYPPPNIDIAASFGSLRTSALRGPIQLAITFAFLAALPLVLALARRRLWLAVGCFIGVAAIVSCFGIWQVVANRLGLPIQNISNDPLVTGRAIPGWRGLLRPYATFGEPSPFAAYLLGPLALAVALAVWPPARRARAAATAAGALIFSAFVLTLSTGAWIALPVLAAIVFAVLAHRRAWWWMIGVPVAAVVVAVATLAPLLSLNERSAASAPPPTSVGTTTHPNKNGTHPNKNGDGSSQPERHHSTSPFSGVSHVASTIANRITDSIAAGRTGPRFEIQRYQVHLWKTHPVLGVGIGAADLYTARKLRQQSLPSTYGVWPGVISETGTVGAIALLLVVAVFVADSVRTLQRAVRSVWYPVVAGALAGVIGELLAYFWFYERIPAHVWALMALGVLASWRAKIDPAA